MAQAPDVFDLARFISAQDDGTYERALGELRAGGKRGHWMWFVFPQIAGLGSSPTSVRYAIGGHGEALAYLEHPLLGPRLLDCCQALLDCETDSAESIFGTVDAMKLRSSMTLFAAVAPEQPVFAAVLDRFFNGDRDQATLARL
jgi:uncharacterized protein (DUF1810 family)